jgi:hypothetical protein
MWGKILFFTIQQAIIWAFEQLRKGKHKIYERTKKNDNILLDKDKSIKGVYNQRTGSPKPKGVER